MGRTGPPDPSLPSNLPVIRWALASGLLLAEGLALTIRFDIGATPGGRPWWGEILRRAPLVPRLALVIAAATLLFGGTSLLISFRRAARQVQSVRRWWPFLLLHFAALAAFTWLTGFLLEGGGKSSEQAGALVVLWVVLALATLGAWLCLLLPPDLWRPLLRHGWVALVLGVAVGAGAWTLGAATQSLWAPLGQATLWVVRGLLSLTGAHLVWEPDDSVIGTSAFSVEVSPECSGYEGIGLIWAFLAVYLWLFRRDLRFPRALWLVPMGTAIMWLANAVRIAGLIAIGTWLSPAAALGGFHSLAGWLIFNLIALALVAFTRRHRFFARTPEAAPSHLVNRATAAYLTPFLVLVGTAMITGAFARELDPLYPLRVLLAAGALWVFRRQYAELRWAWSGSVLAIGILVTAFWLATAPLSSESVGAEEWSSLPALRAGVWLLFRLVGSVVVVPLAEELAFRGYLTRRLIGAHFEDISPGQFTWFSFLGSSLLFGLLHGRPVVGTMAGMLYALALYRRRNLAESVLAHATTNALLVAYALSTGNWSVWN
jgi:exosortase E/protease (VPEID-CTERM system)